MLFAFAFLKQFVKTQKDVLSPLQIHYSQRRRIYIKENHTEVFYMDNADKIKSHAAHEICLTGREKGRMSGIEKVLSSCETSLNLVSSCGNLTINGEKLRITQFNASNGMLEFEGAVSAVKYGGAKQPFLKRIFK